jgi:16S rRNA (guanine1207-N2)-methyltransferase
MTGSHYFDEDPAVPSRPRAVTLSLPDVQLELATDRGVFAGRAPGVDPGTIVLLRAAPPPPAGGALLDLGCGYGPIAVTLARRSPGATVWAVDVNERALELVTANAAAAGVTNVRAARPDDVPPELRWDAIYSNPPVRIGKQALHDLLQRWLPGLAEGAAAWLVVHKHLGSDSLAAWLAGEGWPTRRLASQRGYRVLEVHGITSGGR